MGICEDLRDFGRGFTRIHETLGGGGFVRLWERICGHLCDKDLQDFGRGFVILWERIHGDLQGFVRLWERICNDS